MTSAHVRDHDDDRTEESTPHNRRSWDSLLPLLFGLVMGLLSGFGLVNGRVTVLETNAASQAKTLEQLTRAVDELRELKTSIVELRSSVDNLNSLPRRGSKP